MKTSKKANHHRSALFTGGSAAALMLLLSVGGGALLATSAVAADECGTAADGEPIVCHAGVYPDGITYSGDNIMLQLEDEVIVTDGGLDVDGTTDVSVTALSNVEGGAPKITNTSGAGVTLNSGGATEFALWGLDGADGYITGTSGIVAHGAGQISIYPFSLDITATDPNGYGIYAESVAQNDFEQVAIFNTGLITSAGTGVEARMEGGVGVNVTVGDVVAGGDGIVAVSTGDSPYHNAWVTAGNITAGGDGIVIESPTGGALVQLNGQVNAGSGVAVRINAGGETTLNIGTGVSLDADDFIINTTGSLHLGVSGELSSAGGDASGLIIQQAATDFTLTNDGVVIGRFDLGQMTGKATIDTVGFWHVGGVNTFTGQDDTVTNSVQWWTPNAPALVVVDNGTVFDFGGGADSFTNKGRLAIQGSFTLNDLETFTNTRYIVLGSTDGQTTDGETNDRLAADGAKFAGLAETGIASTVMMDVNLGAGSQDNCQAAVVADCLSFVGGETSGTTHLILNEVNMGAPVLGTHIVLVDVSGGTSSAKDFVLDPGLAGYRTDDLLGTGLDRGFVFYKFGYDAQAQQFGFLAVPDHEAIELAPMAAQAQDVWYSTTGTWLERNTDLREALALNRGARPAGWLKVASTKTDRRMEKDFQGDNPGFWTSYKQDTTEVVGGLDLLRAMADDQALVAGVTLGYAKSDTDFEASPSSTSFKGMTYGAYATYLTGSLFLDGIVQVNKLDVEHKTDWIRAGDFGKGKLTSTGVQVEGGWRIPINESSAYVEPLASLAYVRTQVDDINVPDAVFEADDATSLRGSLGARISGDALRFNAATLNIAATGRVWDEFSAKNKGKLIAGGSANLEDDFGGTFGQVALTFGLRSDGGGVSAFFNTGAKFNADYLSYDNAIGVRVRW